MSLRTGQRALQIIITEPWVLLRACWQLTQLLVLALGHILPLVPGIGTVLLLILTSLAKSLWLFKPSRRGLREVSIGLIKLPWNLTILVGLPCLYIFRRRHQIRIFTLELIRDLGRDVLQISSRMTNSLRWRLQSRLSHDSGKWPTSLIKRTETTAPTQEIQRAPAKHLRHQLTCRHSAKPVTLDEDLRFSSAAYKDLTGPPAASEEQAMVRLVAFMAKLSSPPLKAPATKSPHNKIALSMKHDTGGPPHSLRKDLPPPPRRVSKPKEQHSRTDESEEQMDLLVAFIHDLASVKEAVHAEGVAAIPPRPKNQTIDSFEITSPDTGITSGTELHAQQIRMRSIRS